MAFWSIRDDESDVWVVPAAGGPEVQITNDDLGQAHLRWSTDGTALVFSVSQRRSDLWTVSAAGGTRSPLTSDYENARSPVVSPNGREVAFVSGGG